MKETKIYFPNLNGLRFLAAAGVVVWHIVQFKTIMGGPVPEAGKPLFAILGLQGVEFFFVLSGFLITFLLLEEEKRTGTIRIGRFYGRRALRIWPLYYLTVVLALYLLPHIPFLYRPLDPRMAQSHLLAKTVLYGTFFSNAVLVLGPVPFCAHDWSIGTEEQFYLIWPALMRWVRPKVLLMLGTIAAYFLAVIVAWRFLGHGPWQIWVRGFLNTFNIDCMAIGGLAAVILHRRPRWLPWLINLPLFFAALAATLFLAIRGVPIPYVFVQVYAVLFVIILINFAAHPSLSRTLEFKPMPFLGQISYSMYMWHSIAISFWLHLLLLWGKGWSFAAWNGVLYAVVFLTVIALAALSYRYIERPFLRKKAVFAVVPSGTPS